MKRNVFKLPLYLLISGIALRVFTFVTVRIILRGASEWTLIMGAWATGITAVIAAVLFVLVGLRLRREINRRTCFWSVLLVVGYSLFSLALEQAEDPIEP